jgi:hypothetical protein
LTRYRVRANRLSCRIAGPIATALDIPCGGPLWKWLAAETGRGLWEVSEHAVQSRAGAAAKAFGKLVGVQRWWTAALWAGCSAGHAAGLGGDFARYCGGFSKCFGAGLRDHFRDRCFRGRIDCDARAETCLFLGLLSDLLDFLISLLVD